MVRLRPARRGLIPESSDAAARISAPNYDEFDSEEEVRVAIEKFPESVLRVSMPHCAGAGPSADSPDALRYATEAMEALSSTPLTTREENFLWLYEIGDPERPETRQIGLGGMAATSEVGASIRCTEEVRPTKVQERAALIRATGAFVGVVNVAVEDATNQLEQALVTLADESPARFSCKDAGGVSHSVWIVREDRDIDRLLEAASAESRGYVADGNHRTKAAARARSDSFPVVLFPSRTMDIAAYNRLLPDPGVTEDELWAALSADFRVRQVEAPGAFAPEHPHQVGLYYRGRWYELVPHEPSANLIDAHLVQTRIIEPLFGYDARDENIVYVGSNRPADYLQSEVDSARRGMALSLAPVPMTDFLGVCRQGDLMPPKSTWFRPKLRSGLVVPLLD